MSHWDDEAKIATPVRTHCGLRLSSSARCLVGAVNVGGNFDKVDQTGRNACHKPLANVFEFKRDVLRAPIKGKPQRRISSSRHRPAAQHETLRHRRLYVAA